MAAQIPASPDADVDPAPTLRRVFVIDGSKSEADQLTQRLRTHYPSLDEVRWTAEPPSALDKIEAFDPDLVITDHHMPGHDLFGTITALRRRWPHLPVLVMSAVAGEEAAVRALKAGANNFLPKARSENLQAVIDRELAESRLQLATARLQAAAERQRRVNEAIFSQVQVGLWILSPTGGIERGNRHSRDMLGGFQPLGVEGFASVQARWADTGEPLLASDWPGTRAVERGENVPVRLLQVRTLDGRDRQISCGAVPLRAEDGASLGAVVMAMDVTDEIALQQRLRSAEDRLRHLSLNQSVRHEEQMAALSRELHDNLGQVLSLLKMHLMSAVRPANSPSRRRIELLEALPLVELALKRLREMCGELRPSVLTDFGLSAALVSLSAAATRASGVRVSAAEEGTPLALDPTHQLGLFRVAQQALTNALRHAGATNVRLTLRWTESAAELSVSDDGMGFDPESPRRPEQHGLHGMRERMELLGSLFNVSSSPGGGTTVRASVPGQPPVRPVP